MADIVITSANVVKGTGAQVGSINAGATITAGQTIYSDASGNAQLATALSDVLHATLLGVALNNASLNQPVTYQKAGQITIGGTLVVGGIYLLSGNNPGGICPAGDIAINWRPVILGFGITTSIMLLGIDVTANGTQHS